VRILMLAPHPFFHFLRNRITKKTTKPPTSLKSKEGRHRIQFRT